MDGLLVKKGDIKALAETLSRIYASEPPARQLGGAGYKKVLETFEAGRVTRQLLEYLL